MAREILKRKGQKFDTYYSVIMPDTWTPIFNLTNKEGVERWLNDGKAQQKNKDKVYEKVQPVFSAGEYVKYKDTQLKKLSASEIEKYMSERK